MRPRVWTSGLLGRVRGLGRGPSTARPDFDSTVRIGEGLGEQPVQPPDPQMRNLRSRQGEVSGQR